MQKTAPRRPPGTAPRPAPRRPPGTPPKTRPRPAPRTAPRIVPRIPSEEKWTEHDDLAARRRFTWVFGLMAVMVVILGSWFITDFMQVSTGGRIHAIPFFGAIVACLGVITSTMTVFRMKIKDKYRVYSIGLVFSAIGVLIAVMGDPEIQSLYAGLILLFFGLAIAVSVSTINLVGWRRWGDHRYSVFLIVIFGCLLFLIGLGWLSYETDLLLVSAAP